MRAQWRRMFGPIPSIPAAFEVSSEHRDSYTSSSEIPIVEKVLLGVGIS